MAMWRNRNTGQIINSDVHPSQMNLQTGQNGVRDSSMDWWWRTPEGQAESQRRIEEARQRVIRETGHEPQLSSTPGAPVSPGRMMTNYGGQGIQGFANLGNMLNSAAQGYMGWTNVGGTTWKNIGTGQTINSSVDPNITDANDRRNNFRIKYGEGMVNQPTQGPNQPPQQGYVQNTFGKWVNAATGQEYQQPQNQPLQNQPIRPFVDTRQGMPQQTQYQQPSIQNIAQSQPPVGTRNTNNENPFWLTHQRPF